MIPEEFLSEALAFPSCPKNFEKEYTRFRYFQSVAFDTLKEVHRLCEANGIRYQLAFGSLLGIIRDKGQIPWDYDIDIFIPYEDKERMLDALRNDLNSEYYAWCPEINDKCEHTLMRICPVGFHSEAIHVDVFYIMALPENEEESTALVSTLPKLYHARCAKMMNVFIESYGSMRRLIHLCMDKLRYASLVQSEAEAEFARRCGLYKLSETKYCAPTEYNAPRLKFETQAFWDTELITLDCGTFRITKDYDNVLHKTYGDYMTTPSIESRINEVMRSLKMIDFYSRQIKKKSCPMPKKA